MVEGFCGSNQGAVEDCCCGRGTGGMDIGIGLVGAGMGDVKAIVVHVVAGIRREGLRCIVFGTEGLWGCNV